MRRLCAVNVTTSMPRGLYWLRPGGRVAIHSTVSLPIPLPSASSSPRAATCLQTSASSKPSESSDRSGFSGAPHHNGTGRRVILLSGLFFWTLGPSGVTAHSHRNRRGRDGLRRNRIHEYATMSNTPQASSILQWDRVFLSAQQLALSCRQARSARASDPRLARASAYSFDQSLRGTITKQEA